MDVQDHSTPSGHETHHDDDKEKTPSPKIDKKTSVAGDGGYGEIRGSFSRSEDELFSDAVTEFADGGSSAGSVKKTLDRDLFFSFTDADNAVDTGIEASEIKKPLVEKIEETDEKLEVGEEKGQESLTSVTNLEEAKDSDVTKTAPEVSAVVSGQPENSEKLESLTADGINEETKQEIKSDGEDVSEVVKESETVETEIEKSSADCEITSEAVKGSENDQLPGVGEEIKHEKLESDDKHVLDIAKESEIDQNVSDLEVANESESGLKHVIEVAKESEIEQNVPVFEAAKESESESDHKHILEVAKESEIDQNVPVLIEKVDHGAPNQQIQEVVEKPVAVLTEKTNLEEPELGKSSEEEIKEEAAKEPVAVVTEKEDLSEPHMEKQSSEHTHEVVEKPDSILTTKDLGIPELEGVSEEQIQEVVKGPETVLTEKEDRGGPYLEKQSKEHADEAVKKPDSVLTEKQDLVAPELEGSLKEQFQEAVKEPDTVLTENEDFGGPHLEKQSNEVNEHTDEVVKKPEKEDLAASELTGSLKEQIPVVKEPGTLLTEKEDLGGPHMEKQQSNECTDEVVKIPDSISTEKLDLGAPELEKRAKEVIFEEPVSVLTEKETCSKDEVVEQKANANSNLVTDVSTETIAEEGNGKLMNNQDSAADLTVDSSSHNSLEGNWGSVSVLSTASIDAETSKVNAGKSNAATSDVYEPPSFMTLVEPESKDKKPEVEDSQQPQPNSEASQAGWFPTLTKVNNETEGRKRNEEAMAKVTNWNAEKQQSTPLKNLLGEAKSPSGKQHEPVVVKNDEEDTVVKPPVNDDVVSPPKLIEDDDKKGRKKVKGRSMWVPFVCCSSVNAVK